MPPKTLFELSLDNNSPDFDWKPVIPAIRNFQIIDTNKDSFNLLNSVKENGLMGVLDNLKVQLTAYEMQQIFPAPPKGSQEVIDAFKVRREEVTELLNHYMADYGLYDNNLVAQFLGQVKEETGGLKSFQESFKYKTVAGLETNFKHLFLPTNNNDGTITPALYNPGDYINQPIKLMSIVPYVPYYGRGLLQLTHDYNYSAFRNYYKATYGVDIDILNHPELVATNTNYAVLSALWFFKTNVIDVLSMDTAFVCDVTKQINGGYSGEKRREDYYQDALNEFKAASLNPFPSFKNPPPTFPYYQPHKLFPPFQPLHSIGSIATPFNLNQNQPYQQPQPVIHQLILKPTGFNTTPPGIGNSSSSSITQPVIQNITINNTASSTISPADIQKHMADLLTAAVSDTHIGTTG